MDDLAMARRLGKLAAAAKLEGVAVSVRFHLTGLTIVLRRRKRNTLVPLPYEAALVPAGPLGLTDRIEGEVVAHLAALRGEMS